MTVLKLSPEKLTEAKNLGVAGNVSGAWKLLGDKGDAYAFLAARVGWGEFANPNNTRWSV